MLRSPPWRPPTQIGELPRFPSIPHLHNKTPRHETSSQRHEYRLRCQFDQLHCPAKSRQRKKHKLGHMFKRQGMHMNEVFSASPSSSSYWQASPVSRPTASEQQYPSANKAAFAMQANGTRKTNTQSHAEEATPQAP